MYFNITIATYVICIVKRRIMFVLTLMSSDKLGNGLALGGAVVLQFSVGQCSPT